MIPSLPPLSIGAPAITLESNLKKRKESSSSSISERPVKQNKTETPNECPIQALLMAHKEELAKTIDQLSSNSIAKSLLLFSTPQLEILFSRSSIEQIKSIIPQMKARHISIFVKELNSMFKDPRYKKIITAIDIMPVQYLPVAVKELSYFQLRKIVKNASYEKLPAIVSAMRLDQLQQAIPIMTSAQIRQAFETIDPILIKQAAESLTKEHSQDLLVELENKNAGQLEKTYLTSAHIIVGMRFPAIAKEMINLSTKLNERQIVVGSVMMNPDQLAQCLKIIQTAPIGECDPFRLIAIARAMNEERANCAFQVLSPSNRQIIQSAIPEKLLIKLVDIIPSLSQLKPILRKDTDRNSEKKARIIIFTTKHKHTPNALEKMIKQQNSQLETTISNCGIESLAKTIHLFSIPQLEIVFSKMSEEHMKTIIPNLENHQLSYFIKYLDNHWSNEIKQKLINSIKIMTPNQFLSTIRELSNRQLTAVLENASAEQFLDIASKLSIEQLRFILPSISTMQLNMLFEEIEPGFIPQLVGYFTEEHNRELISEINSLADDLLDILLPAQLWSSQIAVGIKTENTATKIIDLAKTLSPRQLTIATLLMTAEQLGNCLNNLTSYPVDERTIYQLKAMVEVMNVPQLKQTFQTLSNELLKSILCLIPETQLANITRSIDPYSLERLLQVMSVKQLHVATPKMTNRQRDQFLQEIRNVNEETLPIQNLGEFNPSRLTAAITDNKMTNGKQLRDLFIEFLNIFTPNQIATIIPLMSAREILHSFAELTLTADQEKAILMNLNEEQRQAIKGSLKSQISKFQKQFDPIKNEIKSNQANLEKGTKDVEELVKQVNGLNEEAEKDEEESVSTELERVRNFLLIDVRPELNRTFDKISDIKNKLRSFNQLLSVLSDEILSKQLHEVLEIANSLSEEVCKQISSFDKGDNKTGLVFEIKGITKKLQSLDPSFKAEKPEREKPKRIVFELYNGAKEALDSIEGADEHLSYDDLISVGITSLAELQSRNITTIEGLKEACNQ